MQTTRKIRRLRKNTGQAAGCSRSKKQQVALRTRRVNRNGFLNHLFKPFYGVIEANWQKTEREFFNSLSNLCLLYGWKVPDTSHLRFPQNIMHAYKQIEEACNKQQLDCIIAKDKKHGTCIVTVKKYNTGQSLFYIPVRPVYLMLQKQNRNPETAIWLLLFRYLYHAGVPFYREQCYIGSTYDTLQNSIDDCDEDEVDSEYRKIQQEEMDSMNKAGGNMLPLLKKRFNARSLAHALQQYSQSPDSNAAIAILAEECLRLCKDYPRRRITGSIVEGVTETASHERIYLDCYLSFYWSGNDCFYDTLMEWVNSELMEMCYQDEPASLQWFDTPQEKEQHNLDFEERFFALIEKITEQLYKYD